MTLPSDSFAQEFFFLTSDLLCVVGPDGYFVEVNPAWSEALGWTREELLSRPYFEFIHPEDHETTLQRTKLTTVPSADRYFENRFLRKNGGFRWLRWRGPLKREGANVWGLAKDVTFLREENNEQIALIEHLEEGFIIRDHKGEILKFNQTALQLLEISEEELRGKKLMDAAWGFVDEHEKRVSPDDHPSMVVLRTGKSQLKKLLGLILKNGDIRWIQVSSAPLFNTPGTQRPDRVLSVFQDVTDSVVTQKRLAIAVQAGKFGIWEWNIRNDRVFWDESMYEIYGVAQGTFGYNREAVVKLLFEDDRAQLIRGVRKAFATQADFSGEFRIRRPDGAIRIIHTESKGFYDEAGKPIRHVGVNWDITEQREKEFKLVHASKMSSLGEVSAGIAHEINNPLAIILGKNYQINKMLEKATLDEVALQKAVDVIDVTARRIAKIIKGLLSFARDDTLDPLELTDVDALIEDVLSFCRSRFFDHQVQLKFENLHPGIGLECRAPQVMQVLINLLNNAFDAVEGLPEKWVRLTVNEDADDVIFTVVDSGHGISKDIRDKILQPFFTTKQVGKGTGLGLSISLGLVKSHGGSLDVDQNCSNTCFKVRLPKNGRSASL
jgi:PAS domain S-box-containing protein